MLVNGIVNTFYLFILLLFTYLLGRKIKDETTGIIAAVLVALYPLTYDLYFPVSLDFPLMGLTVMSLYMLLCSEHFSKTGYSVLFALSFGWGLMIKQPFGAFLIGPLMCSLCAAARTVYIQNDYRRLFNVLLVAVLSYVIVMVYYFPGIYRLTLGMGAWSQAACHGTISGTCGCLPSDYGNRSCPRCSLLSLPAERSVSSAKLTGTSKERCCYG